MGRLVRNLLDLSRIEGGAIKPELEARDAGEIARQAVQRLNAGTKRVSIEIPATLPEVLVDEVYLTQVLANLLENAVRYGGPAIEMRGRAAPDGRTVELSVEDDGEGVPEQSRGRLFEKFYQLPRAAGTARRGMGIGLTVVAGLAQAMGGSVRAEQSTLGGLAVVVTIPTAEVPVEAEEGAEVGT
jgi:two-component system sensor histidine kinase KdpD